MSYSLNSVKGGYVALCRGTAIGAIKGATRSLDYSSFDGGPWLQCWRSATTARTMTALEIFQSNVKLLHEGFQKLGGGVPIVWTIELGVFVYKRESAPFVKIDTHTSFRCAFHAVHRWSNV